MSTDILSQKLQSLGVSLPKAIVASLIGEIDAAIENGQVRSQDGRHSVYDFIAEIMGQKTPWQVWKRFAENDPDCLTFCEAMIFTRKDGKNGYQESPGTDVSGLIYIAYMGSGDFSQKLRRASAALIASEFSKSPAPSPIAHLERSFAASEQARAEVNEALDKFPCTLERLHRTSGIVSKSQVQRALKASFVRDRDWMVADGRITMSESTFYILMTSFRSASGVDLNDLPKIISLETEKYFQFQRDRRINSRIGKREVDGQMPLLFPADEEYASSLSLLIEEKID